MNPTTEQPLSSAQALVAAFASRVARRDEPPTPADDYFEPGPVQARIGAALEERLGRRLHVYRRRTLSALLYALMQHPELSTPELMQGLDLTDQTVRMRTAQLAAAGLLTVRARGRLNYFGLTRAGEDWLLTAVRGIAPALPGQAAPPTTEAPVATLGS